MTLEELRELATNGDMPDGKFPRVFYNAEGDCLEFLATNESYRAERVDSVVTVLNGRESGELVGTIIKGVKKIIKKFSAMSPGFAVEVSDGKVRVDHLILARRWSADEPLMFKKYQKVEELARTANAEADLEPAAC